VGKGQIVVDHSQYVLGGGSIVISERCRCILCVDGFILSGLNGKVGRQPLSCSDSNTDTIRQLSQPPIKRDNIIPLFIIINRFIGVRFEYYTAVINLIRPMLKD
jgi:hypothetical protein